METTPPRFSPFSLIAPGLVSVSLLASALIIAHRPPAVSLSPAIPRAAAEAIAAPVLPPPPIAQASAAMQFRTQVLTAPTLHTFVYKGLTYTLTDLKVTQVIYKAKEDFLRLTPAGSGSLSCPPGLRRLTRLTSPTTATATIMALLPSVPPTE